MLAAPIFALALLAAPTPAAPPADACVGCHAAGTPAIVQDWRRSRHHAEGVGCATCHGSAHSTAADASKAKIPTPETCAKCHPERVEQFKSGKHAKAWVAMKAMPTIHYQPMAQIDGLRGCGGCHKIGLKTEEDVRAIRKATGAAFGSASCDSCHTRHVFSVAEARSPQACQTCHMGFDHAQWEMWSTSKHGVRALLKQSKVLPDDVAGPTCQTCHMQGGGHGVRTAWGFLAVRLPMPEDKGWAADRATILQGLGVLDPQGKPTPRLEAVKAADVARLTQEDWQKERDRMLATCTGCHAPSFAKAQLALGDQVLRDADHLVAEAIRVVAGLYKDGLLKKPQGYAAAFPDILAFHDAPTVIEQKLFVMTMEHRMRAFQGAFHSNPDYAFWYGYSELKRDLTEIQEEAQAMREAKGKKR